MCGVWCVHACVRAFVCFKQMGETETQAVKWLAPQATRNGNGLEQERVAYPKSPPLSFLPPPLLPTRQPLNAYSKNFEEEKYHLPKSRIWQGRASWMASTPRNFSRICFPGPRLRLQKLVCLVSQSQEDDKVPICLYKPHRRPSVKLEGREHLPGTTCELLPSG